MKIDEACINHNAVKIIDDILTDPYAWACSSENEKDKEEAHNSMLMAIGEINGVLCMVKAMKEVLKS